MKMESYLRSMGFAKIHNKNEWVKGSWTIRIEDKNIEAFQDLKRKTNNKYILLANTEDNIKAVIEAIVYNT